MRINKKLFALFIMPLFLLGCFDDEPNTDTNTSTSTADSSNSVTQNNNSPDCDLSLNITNSWQDNNSNYYQLDINVKNNDNRDITDWVLNTMLPADSSIKQFWNCKAEMKENEGLNLKPEDYNSTIASNTTMNCGLIFNTKENYKEDKLSMVSSNLGSKEDNNIVNTNENKDTSENTETAITPISSNTKLQVSGTNIVDTEGNIIELRGISMHGLNWFPQYINKDTFHSLKQTFNVNAVRLPLYTEEYNGYCSGGNQDQLLNLIYNGIEYATAEDMYVIVDWHILSDANPNKNIEKSKEFFKKITTKYKNNSNIIYEICNEPNGNTNWNDIKQYANQIIPIIRENTDSIIIVGTPTWSQDVDAASTSPLSNYKNIVYSLHFYAATQKDNLRNKATTAIQNNLPIIISEFSICEASGNGQIDTNEAAKWMNFIKENHLSYFIWNLSNKDEKSALLIPSCTKLSNWNDSDLSETGKWYKNH